MSAPLDAFRLEMMTELSNVPSFKKTWPYLRHEIDRSLSATPTAEEIFRLGDRLSRIFTSVMPLKERAAKLERLEDAIAVLAPSSRGQSELAMAGTVWECLVSWYLNLICYGTDVIAARRTNANTPSIITDAITVTLHGYSTKSEADIVVFSVPGIEQSSDLSLKVGDLNRVIMEDAGVCTVAIVQCKTNWNENAQIPMLWDLIYRSTPADITSMQLGCNGVTPRSFKDRTIKYAFMTVPTNKTSRYKEGGAPVTRVRGLSGGNYWGHPTQQGVATGFSEFLNRNFSTHFRGSIQNHINRQLKANPQLVEQFLGLNFARLP